MSNYTCLCFIDVCFPFEYCFYPIWMQVVGHHQWLTLFACVFMWGPYLIERLCDLWDGTHSNFGKDYDESDRANNRNWRMDVSTFLFLLGHTHNLLRSVLHAVFAQQIHSLTWQGNDLDLFGGQR